MPFNNSHFSQLYFNFHRKYTCLFPFCTATTEERIEIAHECFPSRNLQLALVLYMLYGAGTVWTAAAHIITAVIGSGVLSLAWAMAQLGWVAGPVILLLFAAITYYTCCLLSDCYRVGDPATGKRNYTYTEAVESYLGTASLLLRATRINTCKFEMTKLNRGIMQISNCM
jgi:hypothetical protein